MPAMQRIDVLIVTALASHAAVRVDAGARGGSAGGARRQAGLEISRAAALRGGGAGRTWSP